MSAGTEPSRNAKAKGDTTSTVKPTITAADLAIHNRPDDLWIAIDGKVFDITKWANSHPGGEHLLHSTAGQDVTSVFNAFHTDHGSGGRALRMLNHLQHVANLEKAPRSKLAQAFIDLQERVDKEGLYDTSVVYYVTLASWLVLLLAAAVWLTTHAASGLSTAAAALTFALFLQQCAFAGHDTAHNGITHDRFTDMVIGLIVGPLLTGISTAWWKRNHNAHHVVTNSITHDPDIQHMPIFAVTDELWRRHGGTFSFYYKHFFRFDSFAKTLISYQHFLYYPVMAFARWNLYVQGWLLLLNFNLRVQWRVAEIGALLVYWTGLAVLVMSLPTVGLRFLFLLLSHMFAGILHVQITLSHFAMPTYSGPVFNEGELGEEFLRQQLHTSMDVESGWWNEWFYGGLQWQVAHHVFPRVPRHNLRRVREMMQALCREHGLEYKSVGWWQGNVEVIRTLHKAALRARDSKTISFKDSDLWKALNAEG